MAKKEAKLELWADTLKYDMEHYIKEPLFQAHGIKRLFNNERHAWTCGYCGALFPYLHSCLAHCATPFHTSRLWWPYGQHGLPLPAQPQWNTTRSSSASVGASGYRIWLVDATVNGRFPIPNAVLVVCGPTTKQPPRNAAFVMTDARINGVFQPENGVPADVPPVPIGGEVGGDSLSSRRPVLGSGAAPAASVAAVRVQSEQSINDGHLSDPIPTISPRRRRKKNWKRNRRRRKEQKANASRRNSNTAGGDLDGPEA